MFDILYQLNESDAITGGYYALRLLEYRQLLSQANTLRNQALPIKRFPQDNIIADQVIKEIEHTEQKPINLLEAEKVEEYANRLRETIDAISSHSIYNDPEVGLHILEELRQGPSAWKDKPVFPDLPIELTRNLPEYGLEKGQRGIVIDETQEPELTYTAEFTIGSGLERTTVFAKGIKASEVVNLNDFAKVLYDHAVELINLGKPFEAQQEFRRAIDIQPGYLSVLHNLIISSYEEATKGQGSLEQMESLISGLRFILDIKPDFEIARFNIAVVYMNHGVERALQNDIQLALELYHRANVIETPEEFVHRLRWNFIAAYTSLSVQAQEQEKYQRAVSYSRMACAIESNEITRSNLGAAYTNLAAFHIVQKDYVSAYNALMIAKDTGINAPQWYSNLGAVFAAGGSIDLAISYFNHALISAPEDDFAKTNLTNLLALKAATEARKETEYQIPLIGIVPITPIRPQGTSVSV